MNIKFLINLVQLILLIICIVFKIGCHALKIEVFLNQRLNRQWLDLEVVCVYNSLKPCICNVTHNVTLI